jgi:hypothetical protein
VVERLLMSRRLRQLSRYLGLVLTAAGGGDRSVSRPPGSSHRVSNHRPRLGRIGYRADAISSPGGFSRLPNSSSRRETTLPVTTTAGDWMPARATAAGNSASVVVTTR